MFGNPLGRAVHAPCAWIHPTRLATPRHETEVPDGKLTTRTRHYLVVLLALVAVLLLMSMTLRGMPVQQPVAFDHLKHTKELELSCELCHDRVITGLDAGLPGRETCALCHQAPQGESPEAARLTQLLAAGAPLSFNKLFRLPDHVNYTHRRHVGIAQLECRNCHGAIAETQRPPLRPLVRIDMAFCLSCHRARDQSQDCVACHR